MLFATVASDISEDILDMGLTISARLVARQPLRAAHHANPVGTTVFMTLSVIRVCVSQRSSRASTVGFELALDILTYIGDCRRCRFFSILIGDFDVEFLFEC